MSRTQFAEALLLIIVALMHKCAIYFEDGKQLLIGQRRVYLLE